MKKIFGQIYKAVARFICNLYISININVKLNREGGLEDINIVTFFLLKTKIITSSLISHIFFSFSKVVIYQHNKMSKTLT